MSQGVCNFIKLLQGHLFNALFFSHCQEELRELREQPIDPQAEQEIIDSIEEVYFSNDSFDMVQHELEVRYTLFEWAPLTCKIMTRPAKFPRSLHKTIIPSNPTHFSNSDKSNIAFPMWMHTVPCALNLIWLAEVKLFFTLAAVSYPSAPPHAYHWRPDWWIASAQQRKGVKSH